MGLLEPTLHFILTDVFFTAASRCSASSAKRSFLVSLIWIPPSLNDVAGPSSPPSPCPVVSELAHQSSAAAGPIGTPPAGSTWGETLLFRSTLFHHHGASAWCPAYSGRAGGKPRGTPSPDRWTHEEGRPREALHPTRPSAAGSGTKRRNVHVDSIVRDWFLGHDGPVEDRAAMGTCSGAWLRSGPLCPRMFDGINAKHSQSFGKRSSPRNSSTRPCVAGTALVWAQTPLRTFVS